MKVVGYIRVSTEEQAKEGVSLDNQRSRIEAFCTAKDWQLIKVYTDEGKSAAKLDREGIQELLSACKKHEFDVIVVYKLDRLTRSVKDLAYLIEYFEKCSIAFSSVSDNFDTTTANGKLVLNILGSVAQWERDIIAERTKDALGHKKKKKEIYSPTPTGFDLTDTGELIENSEELSTIRKIKKLRRQGLSYWKIADRLNKSGITAKNGSKWYPASVRYVCINDLYEGVA